MKRRRGQRWLSASSALILLTVGCGEPSAPGRSTPIPSVIDAPVGPLPGPAEHDQELPNPFAGDEEALATGRRYFVSYNCAGCHGDHGGGGMGPSLRDVTWLYGNSDERIAKSIAEGRAFGMPAWRQMLTDEQIWQITAYLKSLRTPHEPQPPG